MSMQGSMNNLVIAVSLDSSLDLLKQFADFIVLDEDAAPHVTKKYDTVYIRSHFSTPGYAPQDYREQIDDLIAEARRLNPALTFIDDMYRIDDIVHFEDKWQQYQMFKDFMPRTEVYDGSNTAFNSPIFKKRLSSRGRGITWDAAKVSSPLEDWIIQESLDIKDELRIYIVKGDIYPVATVRKSMSEGVAAQAVNARELTKEEFDFALNIAAKNPQLI